MDIKDPPPASTVSASSEGGDANLLAMVGDAETQTEESDYKFTRPHRYQPSKRFSLKQTVKICFSHGTAFFQGHHGCF